MTYNTKQYLRVIFQSCGWLVLLVFIAQNLLAIFLELVRRLHYVDIYHKNRFLFNRYLHEDVQMYSELFSLNIFGLKILAVTCGIYIILALIFLSYNLIKKDLKFSNFIFLFFLTLLVYILLLSINVDYVFEGFSFVYQLSPFYQKKLLIWINVTYNPIFYSLMSVLLVSIFLIHFYILKRI